MEPVYRAVAEEYGVDVTPFTREGLEEEMRSPLQDYGSKARG